MRCAKCTGKATPCVECQQKYKTTCESSGIHTAQSYHFVEEVAQSLCWCGAQKTIPASGNHTKDMQELAAWPVVAEGTKPN